MPSHSHDHTRNSNFKLSRSQEIILAALDGQDGLSLRKLILSMAKRPISPSEEIEYARKAKAHCDWLAAHNLVVATNRDGHLIYTTNMVLRPIQHGLHYRPSYSNARRLILASAVALVLSACSHNPFATPHQPTEKPIRPYNASTLPVITERIAQFSDSNGEAIYRYCRESECPGPTPKVSYRVAERTTQQLGTPAGRPKITDEKSLKEALKGFAKDAGQADPSKELTAVPTAKVMETERSASQRRTSDSLVSSSEKQKGRGGAAESAIPSILSEKTAPQSSANLKKTEPIQDRKAVEQVSRAESSGNVQSQGAGSSESGMSLKFDRMTSSRAGMVSFSNGAELLNPQSKEQIANLADQAREAGMIKLRGHAASRNLTDEQKKLAIGRSIAVKIEFMKMGIERQKIRIMNPRENDLVDASNVNSDINRSVEIVFLKEKQPIA